MKTPKFKVGDIVVRKAYKDEKSTFLRDEQTIVDVVSDGHPIVAQLWYICKNFRGDICNGLVGVMDKCFILKPTI